MNKLLSVVTILFFISFLAVILLILITDPGMDFVHGYLKAVFASGSASILVFSSYFVSKSLMPPIWSAAGLAFASRLAGSLIVLFFIDEYALSLILPYNGPGFWGLFFMLWGTFSLIKRFEGGRRKFPVIGRAGLIFLVIIPLCITRQPTLWLKIYIVLITAALLLLCYQGFSLKAFREYKLFIYSVQLFLIAEAIITIAESFKLFYFSGAVQTVLPALAVLCLKGLAVREKNKVVR